MPPKSVTINGKLCPKEFTKEELVKMAVKKLKEDEKKIGRLTKPVICDALISGSLPPSAKTKKSTTVKKVAPKPIGVPKKVAPKKVAKETPKKVVAKKAVPASILKKQKSCMSHTKPELVKRVTFELGVAEKDAKKMTKKEICEVLEPGVDAKVTPVEPAPKSPTPKSPKIPKGKDACITQSNMKLREHQIRVVNHMRKNRGLIVCHSLGSGKTLTAVTATQCFLQDHPKGVVKVVTPVSLQPNFKKEMRAYGVDPDKDKRYEFYTLHGFAKEHAKSGCAKNVMLVIDEAHNLRTDISKSKSGRSAVAIKCAKTAEKVMLLTATSVYNEPRDMANLVAMVKGENPLTKNAFEKMMGSDASFNKYFDCTTSFFENPKDETYPTVKEHYVEITMNKKYYKEYMDVENRKSHLFKPTNPFMFLTGVRQASNALTECMKCMWVMEQVKLGRKMVIYSQFLTFGLEKLKKDFKTNGVKYEEVIGPMEMEERAAAVKRYNENKAQVLLISKAGGEGLDLKGTRSMILFEKSWQDAGERQAIGRTARYGSHAALPLSERTVDVYHLLMVKPKGTKDTRPSADTMLKALIRDKNRIIAAFMKKLYPLSIEQKLC